MIIFQIVNSNFASNLILNGIITLPYIKYGFDNNIAKYIIVFAFISIVHSFTTCCLIFF